MEIKAVFLDIDGTLLSHTTESVPLSAQRAIREAQARGVRVFAATGRHICELDQLPLAGVKFDGYVLLNGALCMDAERKVLFGCPLPAESVAAIVERLRARPLPCWFNEAQRMYMNLVTEDVVRVQASIGSPIPPVEDPARALSHEIYQLIPFVGEEDFAALFSDLPGLNSTRWTSVSVDVINARTSKTEGILQLLAAFGLPADAYLAVGDGENDAEMLRRAPIGVAMGNAEPVALAAADHVSADIDDDGLAAAFRRFGLCD